MSSPRIAFVTFDKEPQIAEDDAIAAAALRDRNAKVEAAVWSDPSVRWDDFDLVVIRSTWDYHERAPEFSNWLERLERTSARVWNPVGSLIWNMDKRYLLELAGKGVPIVPTRRLERGEHASLENVLRQERWTNVVVKPAVSAGSFGTFRASLADADKSEQAFHRLLANSDVLVQPFVEEILEGGEWSLLFFGNEFSHALVKRPSQGDFRTQSSFGATHARVVPGEGLLRQARTAIEATGERHLYARVDGVMVREQFQLMELELIEPCLYLDRDRPAAERFANAAMALTK